MNRRSAFFVLFVAFFGAIGYAMSKNSIFAVLEMTSLGMSLIGGFLMGYYLDKMRHG